MAVERADRYILTSRAAEQASRPVPEPRRGVPNCSLLLPLSPLDSRVVRRLIEPTT